MSRFGKTHAALSYMCLAVLLILSPEAKSSNYHFNISISKQFDTAASFSELAKAHARCSTLTKNTALGFKRTNKTLHDQLMESSRKLQSETEKLLLLNRLTQLNQQSSFSKKNKEVMVKESKKTTSELIEAYEQFYDEFLKGVLEMKSISDDEQAKYQNDIKSCIDIAKSLENQVSLSEFLDEYLKSQRDSKVEIDKIHKKYPYEESLYEMSFDGLSEKEFEDTVMRCGGLLQAYVNGVKSKALKIPNEGKKYTSLLLLAVSISRKELEEAQVLTEDEIREVVTSRVTKEFEKHETFYKSWIKYKNAYLQDIGNANGGITLFSFLNDERECLALTNQL